MLLIKLAGKDRAKVWAETEALNRLPEVVVKQPGPHCRLILLQLRYR